MMNALHLIKPDIEEVVSRYTVIRPTGKHLRGLCPLHAERTPSFFVKPFSQTFHCYGCGAGGDVIEFIKQAENLDFKAACEHLGIELKPTQKTRLEIREKELVQNFRVWCMSYHNDLCTLYRTLYNAKRKAKTIEDVEKLVRFYHLEPLWIQQMDILESRDDEAKFELYREVCHE